jgi:hypothetical protein
MPTVYADNKDARIISYHNQWFRARDAISGSTQSIPGHGESSSPYICGYSPHNKTIPEFNTFANYHLIRSFYYFDFSSVTKPVGTATLSIYGLTNGGLDCRIIKSTAFGGDGQSALATSDWTAIPGYNAGGTLSGNVTEYSSEITSWNTSGYNNFVLNDAARSVINAGLKTGGNRAFIVCLIDSDLDYPYNSTAMGGSIGGIIPNPPHNGGYFSEEGGTSRDPKIDYTVIEYGKVNGVAKADIGKVNAVGVSDAHKIIGR